MKCVGCGCQTNGTWLGNALTGLCEQCNTSPTARRARRGGEGLGPHPDGGDRTHGLERRSCGAGRGPTAG